MDDKELSVKVALGVKDREVDQTKQRLDLGIDEVWVDWPNQTVSDDFTEKIVDKGLPMERIRFRRFRDVSDTDIFE